MLLNSVPYRLKLKLGNIKNHNQQFENFFQLTVVLLEATVFSLILCK